MSPRRNLPPELADALEMVAPGTDLRDGIDNIIRASNGALVVVANQYKLERMNIVSGGMKIGLEFSPMRLYELAKMDGAIVVSPDLSMIHYVNVYLTPDATLESDETGTRHLAGHRTARQTGDLVIVVSERRRVVSLYQGPYGPHVLEDIGVVLSKANSALATLEKFTVRLTEEARNLTVHEYDGAVTLREVVGAISTFEYSARIADEIEAYVRELGSEGRLIEMQLEQAFHNVPDQYDAILKDYVDDGVDPGDVRDGLHAFTSEQLVGADRDHPATWLRFRRAGGRGAGEAKGIQATRKGAASPEAGGGTLDLGVRLAPGSTRRHRGGTRRGRGRGPGQGARYPQGP